MSKTIQPSESRQTAPAGGLLGLMSVEQVAQELGYSVWHVYYLTSKGMIPHLKVNGGRLRFVASEILEWLKAGRNANTERTAEIEAMAEAKLQEMKAKSTAKRQRKGAKSNVASV